MSVQQFWSDAWYQGRWWLHLLRPLSCLFSWAAYRRRLQQQAAAQPVPVPVVVVGNISLGGTGKTPLLIALLDAMRARGFRPGVVSRGYGGTPPYFPFPVTATTDPIHSGDEPLLIAIESGCPVVIAPRRADAVTALLEQFDCDLIFSDDGLQHYHLARDIEICVVDGQRGLGNGLCLPAGPLREPPQRLAEVDWVVTNGSLQQPLTVEPSQCVDMQVMADSWLGLQDHQKVALIDQQFDKPLLAVSGIGNPQRFFDSLAALGLTFATRVFADHHSYTAADFAVAENYTVVMTSKDAVKCRSFARPNWWALTVKACLSDTFFDRLAAQIRQVADAKKHTSSVL